MTSGIQHPMKQQALRRKAIPEGEPLSIDKYAGSRGNRRARQWFTCPECGKRFSINNSDAVKRPGVTNLPGLFCRKSCHTEWVRKNGRRGELLKQKGVPA